MTELVAEDVELVAAPNIPLRLCRGVVQKESTHSRNAEPATACETEHAGRKVGARHTGTKSKCMFCDNAFMRPGLQRPPKYRKKIYSARPAQISGKNRNNPV
jgi:hypothetical protein